MRLAFGPVWARSCTAVLGSFGTLASGPCYTAPWQPEAIRGGMRLISSTDHIDIECLYLDT